MDWVAEFKGTAWHLARQIKEVCVESRQLAFENKLTKQRSTLKIRAPHDFYRIDSKETPGKTLCKDTTSPVRHTEKNWQTLMHK